MNAHTTGASALAIFNFKNSHTHEIRVVIRDGEPWFVASDIADAPNMSRILDDDEKGTHIVSTLGGNQEITIISESGLYHAVLKSRKPQAKAFRKWVTSEVLPAIRKTGRYEAVTQIATDDEVNLKAAIWSICDRHKQKDKWNQAIWKAIRESTGRPPMLEVLRLVLGGHFAHR